MRKPSVGLALALMLLLCVSIAQAQNVPPAEIINDEGGPVVITGRVTYTNPFFTAGVTQPVVMLEDQGGFVERNEGFLFPPASQTLGQLTSDFYSSPFSYSIALPIEPQGSLHDVDLDGEEDTGVMVFAVAYWENIWGDPYLEERDQLGAGWSTAYASTRVSDDPDHADEIVGGKYLIYAPDDEQGFPSGFGDDGLLFTEDDPIFRIPQGYSVVDLDSEPFVLDRAREQEIDLIEPEGAALDDFSDMTFTEAFDAMIEKFRTEYAFTEYKNINWDAISAKYRSRFVEADENDDEELYLDTLAEIIWALPDGHINVGPFNVYQDQFFAQVSHGIGISIRETDDLHSYVMYVLEDSPADQAGIEVGAEILAINGIPMPDHLSRVRPFAETFSTPHNRRLAQQRYGTRFGEDVDEVEITFQNESDSQPTTETIDTEQEFESLFFSFATSDSSPFEVPVEYTILPSGYAYVEINSFLDNFALTIQLWERLMETLNSERVPGLVVDMRANGGGNPFLADQMAAYFFDEPLITGYRGTYSEERGEFYFDPDSASRMFLPPENLRYNGAVAVLIGAECASACERFAYDLTLEDRAEIIGFYPTAGLGGGVTDFRMPLNMTIRMTVVRSVNADFEIHIEGTGVPPTIHIPVTKETLFYTGDLVLETAIEYLDEES